MRVYSIAFDPKIWTEILNLSNFIHSKQPKNSHLGEFRTDLDPVTFLPLKRQNKMKE